MSQLILNKDSNTYEVVYRYTASFFLLNFKDNKNPLNNLKLFSGFYPIYICLEID